MKLFFIFFVSMVIGCASIDPSKDITTIRILSDRISKLESEIEKQEIKIKEQEISLMTIRASEMEGNHARFVPRLEPLEKNHINGLTNKERELILLLLNNYMGKQ